MLHLLSATLPPSVLPLCPGLVTLALAWLATAQVPALSEPESPHFSPPQPLQGAGGVTWGTAWKPLAGAGVIVNARLNQDSFSSFKNEILKVHLHRCREGEAIPWKVKNRTLKGCC